MLWAEAECDAQRGRGFARALLRVSVVIRPVQCLLVAVDATVLACRASERPHPSMGSGVVNVIRQVVALHPTRVGVTSTLEFTVCNDACLTTVALAQPLQTSDFNCGECSEPHAAHVCPGADAGRRRTYDRPLDQWAVRLERAVSVDAVVVHGAQVCEPGARGLNTASNCAVLVLNLVGHIERLAIVVSLVVLVAHTKRLSLSVAIGYVADTLGHIDSY